MKKFRFRLEQVLRYRRALRDEKLRLLMEANQALREAEARLEFLETEARNNAVADGAALRAEDFLLRGMYGARVKAQIAETLAMIEIRKETAREATSAYIEASKEVKTLETLKERKEREYLDRIAHEEGKILDELATQRGNTLQNGN